MSDAIREAADRLHQHLFAGQYGLGAVGMGTDRIYVYVFGKWRGPKPGEWEGFPLEWRTKTGKPVAFDVAGSAA